MLMLCSPAAESTEHLDSIYGTMRCSEALRRGGVLKLRNLALSNLGPSRTDACALSLVFFTMVFIMRTDL